MPNSTWDLGEDTHTNRTEITTAMLNDKIFVIEDADYREDGAIDTVGIYDPNSNEWTVGPSLPYELDHAPSVVYEGSITNAESYDPVADKWAIEPNMKINRSGLSAVAYDGKIYVFGGQHEGLNALSINEILDPG